MSPVVDSAGGAASVFYEDCSEWTPDINAYLIPYVEEDDTYVY